MGWRTKIAAPFVRAKRLKPPPIENITSVAV